MTKPYIVLLPGLLSDKQVFRYQIEHLKSIANLQVITTSDLDCPIAMTDKILNFSPEKFLVVGHSLGGWLALRLVKVAPQRIIKLCLLNIALEPLSIEEIKARQIILSRINNNEFDFIIHELAEKFTFNARDRRIVYNMFVQVGEQALINQSNAMMQREDLSELLPDISCPTGVLHSEHDQRFSFQSVKKTVDLIPHSLFRVIPDCGHMSPMEQPELVASFISEWLKL